MTETEEAKALEVAERIRRSIERHHLTFEGHRMQVTVSIGVASFPCHSNDGKNAAETGKSLIAAADNALYKARQAGRNCVVSAEMTND